MESFKWDDLKEKIEGNFFVKVFKGMLDKTIGFNIFFFLLSIVCIFNEWFFCVMLLDLLNINPTIGLILKALGDNYQ